MTTPQLKPRLTDEFLRTVNPKGEYTVTDSDRNWHRLSPTMGVTYDFDDHYTWYGQYAEGFRTPSAKALYGRFENLGAGYTVQPNPDLDPEKSRSYETGLRGKFETGTFDIAVFYNQYRDFINEDAVTPGATSTVFQSNNIKHATIKGVELKGRLNLDSFGAPQGLYSQGAIAYAHGKNEDNGQPINSVNPLKGVFGLGYEQQQYGGPAQLDTGQAAEPSGQQRVQVAGRQRRVQNAWFRHPRPGRLLQGHRRRHRQRRPVQPHRQEILAMGRRTQL